MSEVRPLLPENCDYLPVWKKNATAEERFLELAAIAAKNPEWFARTLIIYQEDKDGRTQTRYIGTDMKTAELLGMLTMTAWEVKSNTHK